MDLLQCEMNRLFYLWMNRSNCKFSNKKPSQARRFQLRFGLQNEFQFNFEVLKEERKNERTKQKKKRCDAIEIKSIDYFGLSGACHDKSQSLEFQ